MKNEDKIMSMLDFIASELKDLKETTVTKDEFKSFKEQTYHRFDQIETKVDSLEDRMSSIEDRMGSIEDRMGSIEDRMGSIEDRMGSIEDRMVTKDEFLAFAEENNVAHEGINAKINEQSELLEAQFDVLNDRLFNQETQLRIMKRKEVL